MNSNQKLLVYFAQKHSKPTVTVLMKLCYLTDLIYYKKHNKQITKYTYLRYTFGPFDKAIYSDLEELVKQGVLESEIEYGSFGDDIESVVYKPKADNIDVELADDELAIADEILEALGGHGASALTDIAYKTKPMVKFGATLGGNEHLGEVLDLAAK